LRDLAALAAKHGVLLISDEIYRIFCYDGPFHSAAEFNEHVLVVDGFSKSHGMTGWRLGFAHGPRRLIEEMNKLQQFTFVCAPSMVQHAGVVALDVDVRPYVELYRNKRDMIYEGLKDRYDLGKPGGAFYLFPRAPRGSGTNFVQEAIAQGLLAIPGNVFSNRDTHFRLSYAADERTLQRGVEILRRLA
jgi:aspartate aminotransferase/aminotransferase